MRPAAASTLLHSRMERQVVLGAIFLMGLGEERRDPPKEAGKRRINQIGLRRSADLSDLPVLRPV